MDDSPRLLIVSNRLPVTIVPTDAGHEVHRSAGGLATGLHGPHQRSGGLWIGWPGAAWSGLDGASVREELRRLHMVPVELSAEEERVFYGDISNAVLWPLCHDRLDQLPLRVEGWDVYEEVNRRFADVVVQHYRPGDVIWVHDYQLMLVPEALRRRLPGARIGFFLHIPFPNPELFFVLPTRRWLVEGMMGADLVAFHTRRYRGHFTAALRRLFGLEMDADGTVAWHDRRVSLGIFPMSVDTREIARRANTPDVSTERIALRSGVSRLLVGIDRLDYSKGIPRRLLAFERLLELHPEWRGRVHLVQVAVPSRGSVSSYRRFRREVDALVGRINGDHATPTWTPVRYLYRSIPMHTLLALYRAADAMLVTPLRDGMNLVAKEFVASRVDEDGVLILSEFAGAADELTDALIVNPYDVDSVAESIHAALVMQAPERRRRMRGLRAQVTGHDVHRWVERFLDALEDARPAGRATAVPSATSPAATVVAEKGTSR